MLVLQKRLRGKDERRAENLFIERWERPEVRKERDPLKVSGSKEKTWRKKKAEIFLKAGKEEFAG